MPTTEIPFGELLPDQTTYKSPGLVKARNAIPIPAGYGPFLGPRLSSDVLADSVVRGSARLVDASGAFLQVAGTVGGNLIVSRLGTSAATAKTPLGAGQAWRFAQFNNYVIAAAPGQAPQYLTNIATDDTWSDLPGSPPQAAVVGRLGDFLVMGDTSLSTPNRVEWSAFNDPTTWGIDALKQMGGFNFPQESGRITAIVSEPFPCVFQQRAVWSFNPSGGASVFTRIPASRQIGAVAPGSVISRGQEMAFLSREGFFTTDGSGISPIGSSRVNRFFLSDVDDTRISEVHGVVDWRNECYVWAYPTTSTSDFDRLIIYSYAQQRWATAVVNIQYLTEGSILALTPSDLDGLFGDMDSVPYLSDDPIFKTRGDILSAWVDNSGDATFATFTGASLQADFETGAFQPSVGQRSFVSGFRLLAENAAQNSQCAVVGTSPVPGADRTVEPFTNIEMDGFSPQLAEGAFMGAACRIPAGAAWDKAQGVQVRFEVAGDA